jgi:hypothetical protein
MGGVAKAVTKPFEKVGESLGIIKEKQATSPAPLAEMAKMAAGGSAAATAANKSESATAGEVMAARRRARRGGRALLSEARLAPEQGVATLGNTGV